MLRRSIGALTLGAALSALACEPSPSAPTAAPAAEESARPPDGSTLKIDAPVLLGPPNGSTQGVGSAVALVVSNVRGRYASFPVMYEVEIRRPEGTVVASLAFPQGAGTSTSFDIPTRLDGRVPLTWRARARYETEAGPWSTTRTFTVEQVVRIGDLPGTLSVGMQVQARAVIAQQAQQTDCTERAIWTVDNPAVLAVSGGLVTATALGDVALRADCDGIFGLSRGIK